IGPSTARVVPHRELVVTVFGAAGRLPGVRYLVIGTLGVSFVACQCSTEVEKKTFRCLSDADCTDGQRCHPVTFACGEPVDGGGGGSAGGGAGGGGTAGGGAAGGRAGGSTPARLVFVPPPQQLRPTVCSSAATVEARDSSGAPSPLGSATIIALSVSPPDAIG